MYITQVRDRLHQHLRAFALQELEHVEVAVAFGGLRPELADDLDHRLHAQAIDLDRGQLLAHRGQGFLVGIAVKLLADLGQRVDPDLPLLAFVGADLLRHPLRQVFVIFERLALAQHGAKRVHRFVENTVGRALFHFEWTNAEDHLVHDVAQVQRVEHAHAEVHRKLQPRLARGRLHAVVLLEQQHAEAVEACVLQGQAILGLIHAEAARATGASGEEDVVVDDLLLGHAAGFQALQILHQVAHRKIRRIALPVVAVFLAELERRHIRHRQDLAAVAAAFEDGLDDLFVLPGQAAEENRHLAALLRGEGTLDGTLEVTDRATIEAHHAGQPRAFLRQLPLNLFLGLRTSQFVQREIDVSHRHGEVLFCVDLCCGRVGRTGQRARISEELGGRGAKKLQ